jgi:hypothetical protein
MQKYEVYWPEGPENVIDWLGKWRPTCVMRHARGQKLQSFRRKWPFYMDLYSMTLFKNTVRIPSHIVPEQCSKCSRTVNGAVSGFCRALSVFSPASSLLFSQKYKQNYGAFKIQMYQKAGSQGQTKGTKQFYL